MAGSQNLYHSIQIWAIMDFYNGLHILFIFFH